MYLPVKFEMWIYFLVFARLNEIRDSAHRSTAPTAKHARMNGMGRMLASALRTNWAVEAAAPCCCFSRLLRTFPLWWSLNSLSKSRYWLAWMMLQGIKKKNVAVVFSLFISGMLHSIPTFCYNAHSVLHEKINGGAMFKQQTRQKASRKCTGTCWVSVTACFLPCTPSMILTRALKKK